MARQSSRKDQWSTESYNAAASFVPKLTQTLLHHFDPQAGDKVLDIGCGDGKFVAKYVDSVKEVLGLDSSPNLISAARKEHPTSKTRFEVVDCRYMEKLEDAISGTFDKVISNAALHWILRDPNTRLNTLSAILSALKPGGMFVFEMGGAGNVSEVHAALLAALMHQGVPVDEARNASPWFFPSETWMRKTLEDVGFKVKLLETEYRPTKLTTSTEGGLRGWVKLMGAEFLNVLEDEDGKKAAVDEVCKVLETVITRIEDGSQWLGYVRLRGVAEKVTDPVERDKA